MSAGSMPGDQIPVPDPTVLTSEQILREIERLEKLVEARITVVSDVNAEKFHSVDKRFLLVEQQRIEQKADTKAAVDAALTAQKEAVREQTTASDLSIAKSEAATSKQLDQLAATFSASIVSLTTSLHDMKDRIGKIESIRQGGKEQLTGVYALMGAIAAVLGIVIVLSSVLTSQ